MSKIDIISLVISCLAIGISIATIVMQRWGMRTMIRRIVFWVLGIKPIEGPAILCQDETGKLYWAPQTSC